MSKTTPELAPLSQLPHHTSRTLFNNWYTDVFFSNEMLAAAGMTVGVTPKSPPGRLLVSATASTSQPRLSPKRSAVPNLWVAAHG
ncbi:hypothetical protein AVEN_173026-1 [Araneus ventricosus]|uniref:Uncharacterized protein n=1 Tax=Araneus ventricosus TaxID=182803 RepID=A0A4Y2WEZ0_ARAVE|nr:hypothetical protein AVEN_173026-1 [Araneus ventricosus]